MLVKHLHFEQNPFPARGIQVIIVDFLCRTEHIVQMCALGLDSWVSMQICTPNPIQLTNAS